MACNVSLAPCSGACKHDKQHTLAAICPDATGFAYAGCASGMYWTDDKLRQTIAQFRPVFLLHRDEQFLPCSVEWYNERSELWLQQPNESSQASCCYHLSSPDTLTLCLAHVEPAYLHTG